jgi:hypothetical protein
VSTVKIAIDTLRGQFHRYRYRRLVQDYGLIAEEIGIAKATLHKFAKGGAAQEDVLDRIEQWCEREARKQEHVDATA